MRKHHLQFEKNHDSRFLLLTFLTLSRPRALRETTWVATGGPSLRWYIYQTVEFAFWRPWVVAFSTLGITFECKIFSPWIKNFLAAELLFIIMTMTPLFNLKHEKIIRYFGLSMSTPLLTWKYEWLLVSFLSCFSKIFINNLIIFAVSYRIAIFPKTICFKILFAIFVKLLPQIQE